MPAIPVPASAATFCAPMPPMATTGMRTAAQIARSVSSGTSQASSFVEVENTAPTPR